MTPSNITLTAAEVARVRLLVFQVQHRDLRGNNKGYNQLRQVQVLLQRAERRATRKPRAAANRLLQDPQVIKDIFNNNNNENL
jgi:hypothetical protein